MHDFDEMIEKYKKELLEFSKQNPQKCFDERKGAPTEAQPAEKRPQEDEVQEYVIVRPYEDYADFEQRNGSRGTLRVQAFAADRSFPVSGAEVVVEVPLLTGNRELFRGKTNADGIIDNITLPAPDKSLSLDEDNTLEPFALYNISVRHPEYALGEYANVAVFDSVKSVQPAELIPLTQSENMLRSEKNGGEADG